MKLPFKSYCYHWVCDFIKCFDNRYELISLLVICPSLCKHEYSFTIDFIYNANLINFIIHVLAASPLARFLYYIEKTYSNPRQNQKTSAQILSQYESNEIFLFRVFGETADTFQPISTLPILNIYTNSNYIKKFKVF